MVTENSCALWRTMRRTQLIYVVAGNTNNDIRNVFANMDSTNDTETIELIAGGYTLRKCNSDRSGFEGAWIFTPMQWSVSYIENLLDLDWFESEARQFNNTGNTLMMLVADFDLKEDADYLVALNTYRDDSDNVQFYFYTHVYSRPCQIFGFFLSSKSSKTHR